MAERTFDFAAASCALPRNLRNAGTAIAARMGRVGEAGEGVDGADLNVAVGGPPAARVRGELLRLPGAEPLDADTSRTLLSRILTTEEQKRFEIDRQLDFSYDVPGVARFR